MEESGRSLQMRGVITGYLKDKMISFQLESKIHAVEVSYSVAGEPGKSVARMQSTIHWKFPMTIMSIIFGRKMKSGIVQQTQSEFAELKRLCEE